MNEQPLPTLQSCDYYIITSFLRLEKEQFHSILPKRKGHMVCKQTASWLKEKLMDFKSKIYSSEMV